MSNTLAFAPPMVARLYLEALALSEEVRAAFAPTGEAVAAPLDGAHEAQPRTHVSSLLPPQTHSRIALRTTTRMMHAIAWLLNHRAYFTGQISAAELKRHGALALDLLHVPPAEVKAMPAELEGLVRRTQAFYERLLRLDACWRLSFERSPSPSAIERLRRRLEERLAS